MKNARENKGITLVSLIILITVLLILSSIAVYSGIGTIRYTNFMGAKSQVEIMQTNVNSWNNSKDENVKNYGTQVSYNDYKDAFDAAGVSETDSQTYRLFTPKYIEETLEIGGIDKEFLISVSKREVILAKGIKYQDKMYYTPEDFEINNVKYNPIGSAQFDLALDSAIIVKNLRFYDNDKEVKISKFVIEYSNDNTNWEKVDSSAKIQYQQQDAYALPITDDGNYIVRIKDIDGKIIGVNNINITYIREELDGAMVLGKETTAGDDNLDKTGMTMDSKYNDIVTITDDGIVKCNKKEGDAIVTVNGTTYKVHSTAKIVYTQTGASAPISGTASYDNPTIPTGFSAIDTNDAKWNKDGKPTTENLNNGLVIMDGNGNQFVWVPVQNVEATDTARGMARKLDTTEKDANGKTQYRGVLYNWNQENYPERSYSATSGYREPSILSYYDGMAYKKSGSSISTVDLGTAGSKPYLSIITDILGDTTKYGTKFANKYTDEGTFGKTMQEDYDLMIESVKKYGGFYVARYESSLIKGKTRLISGSYSMNASQETTSYMWYGLYARQRAYADDNGVSLSVTSSMIWGSQYDAMLNWMVSTGKDVTTKADNRTDGTSRNRSRITGATKNGSTTYNDKLNNIYDILGNSIEWTLEAYVNNYYRVSRGGFYSSSNSPSVHNHNDPTNASAGDIFSSRTTLYVN